MDYTEIINLVIKLVILAFFVLVGLLLPKVKTWLNGKLSEQQVEQVMNYITIFVDAAEQLLKADDPTGEKRKAYVVEQLTTIGISVNEQIDAMIEAQVLQLKQ